MGLWMTSGSRAAAAGIRADCDFCDRVFCDRVGDRVGAKLRRGRWRGEAFSAACALRSAASCSATAFRSGLPNALQDWCTEQRQW